MDKSRVLYEDNHLIAVNKLPGDLVQGDRTGDKPLLDQVREFLEKKYDKPKAFIGLIHRIDRPVSGVVLFAKTSKGLSRMNSLFHDRKVEKTYWAVVKNTPPNPADTLVHFLKKNQEKNKSFAKTEEVDGYLRSELSYSLKKKLKTFVLLEVKPKTGRHHQIRVQLSSIDCPIKGDVKYGFDRPNRDQSIHLHARYLEFEHPIKNEWIKIAAPPPDKDVIWRDCQRVS